MTVDELRAALAGFDGSEVVCLNTITERNKGMWPAADEVTTIGMVRIGENHYRCVALTVSDWPV